MGIIRISRSICGTDLVVVEPEVKSESGKYKSVWALHGMFRSPEDWVDPGSRLPEYLKNEPVYLICPMGESGFYVDEPGGRQWETEIMGKAWDYAASRFPVSDKRGDTAVIGFSMGGYGAMRYGLCYPERFGYVGCFAGGVNVPQRYSGGENIMDMLAICFGDADKVVGSGYDLYEKAKELSVSGRPKPEIFMCVGWRDPHENGPTQEYRDYLTGLGFDVAWDEGDYGHNMEFVNAMLPGFLNKFLKK